MAPRVAVVGHVEWVEFLRVPHVPRPGEIVHATDVFSEAAGGGGVAAVQLRKLAGECTFFTSLADDQIGHAAAADFEARGVDLRVAWRSGEAQRRAVVFVDPAGERTITVLGDRLPPKASDDLGWGDLAEFDAVYLTAGDVAAVQAARAANVVVATSRVLPLLQEAGVQLDAVVGSSKDAAEAYAAGDLDPAPHYTVMTAGASGGTIARDDAEPAAFAASELPGPVVDAYGAGDSFAAGLTFGLGAGMSIEEAVALGARCGAHNMTGAGSYEGQLEIPSRRVVT